MLEFNGKEGKGFKEFSNGFDIANETVKDIEMSEELIEKSAKAVIKELTDNKGTADDEIYGTLIASATKGGDKDAQKTLKETIKKIIEDKKLAKAPLSSMLAKKIYEDNYGFGAIDDLCGRENVNEIMVNGHDKIFLEIGGKLVKEKSRKFKDDSQVEEVIRRLLQYVGKDITLSNPKQEGRLADGSRLTVSIPPFSKRPYINIRKHDAFDVTIDNFVKAGSISLEILEFIKKAIKARLNILIIGECGSGKTTLLKLLAGFYPENLRLVVIELNAELNLETLYPDRNIASYEANPKIGIDLSECFIHALVARPDRIICGEVRGQEADEMIRTKRRGHPGSMSNLHTNSPETAIDDLAEMINEDGKRRDPAQLRHRVALAIDLIIQLQRMEETGERKATRITEVVADHKSFDYDWNDIFLYDEAKECEKGELEACGKGAFLRVGNLKKPDSIKKLHDFGLRTGLTMEDINDMTNNQNLARRQ